LNRVPARYEGAALPGELSWHIIPHLKGKYIKSFKIKQERVELLRPLLKYLARFFY